LLLLAGERGAFEKHALPIDRDVSAPTAKKNARDRRNIRPRAEVTALE
jgi:hypothetical protein